MGKIRLGITEVRRIVNRTKELPFAPVKSKIKLDMSPKRFEHSIKFSQKMDRAHMAAMNDPIGYGS